MGGRVRPGPDISPAPFVAETPVTVDFCPGLSTPVRDTRGQGQPRPFSSISLPQVTSEHSSHDE
jgi:hypothetical protein